MRGSSHARTKNSELVDNILQCMNDRVIRDTFDFYKDPQTDSVAVSSVGSALSRVGKTINSSEIDEICKSMNLREDEGLQYQDFYSLVTTPSPIEEWVCTLPISQIVTRALLENVRFLDCHSRDQLRHLSQITQDQLEVSCDVIMECLAIILQEQLVELKKGVAKVDWHTAPNINKKFQIGRMEVGNIDNFHQGLASRIGKSAYLV
jgi:hypothetical protein